MNNDNSFVKALIDHMSFMPSIEPKFKMLEQKEPVHTCRFLARARFSLKRVVYCSALCQW